MRPMFDTLRKPAHVTPERDAEVRKALGFPTYGAPMKFVDTFVHVPGCPAIGSSTVAACTCEAPSD